MDLKKIGGFESVMPQPATGKTPASPGTGPSFRDTLEKMSSIMPQAPTTGAGMARGLDGVKFSNHAVDRMRTRGISFTPEDMNRLNDAVARAAAKGSKDSLILMNDSALIVSVKNKTVVTVMDSTALKENVFTNIDSTIVI